MEQQQEGRRADSVAIPRSTAKAAAWVLSAAALGVAGFIWDSGSAVSDLEATLKVIDLRIAHLEQFGPKTGDRFTAEDGRHLQAEIRELDSKCDAHGTLKAHREQEQLNREIQWRLEKLEAPGSDSWRLNGNLLE